MKKAFMSLIFGSLIFTGVENVSAHLYPINMDNASKGTLDPARVNPATFTMLGSNLGLMVSGATTTIQNQINVFSGNLTTANLHSDALDVTTGTFQTAFSTTGQLISALSLTTASYRTIFSTIGALAVSFTSSSQSLRTDLSTTATQSYNSMVSLSNLSTAFTTNSVTASNTNYVTLNKDWQIRNGSFSIISTLNVGLITSTSTVLADGYGGVTWTGAKNTTVLDGVYASETIPNSSDGSFFMILKPAGANVPDGAIITGVKMVVNALANQGTGCLTEKTVQLAVSSSALGSNLSIGRAIQTSANTFEYGGFDSLWGLTLTPSIVNSPSFGAALQYHTGGCSDTTISVDYVSLSIYYYSSTNTFIFGVSYDSGVIINSTLTVTGRIVGDGSGIVNLSTGPLQLYINNAFVSISTSQAEFKASSTSVQNNINLTDRWLSTTTTEMHTLSVPVGFSEEGSFLANATRVDFVGANVTATNTGSTITVTVAAGGAAATQWTPCSVRLGPLNSPPGSVDISSNTINGWDAALRWVGISSNPLVLLQGPTVFATVCMATGVYTYSPFMIPPGLTLYGTPGGSTTIVLTDLTNGVTIYGSIKGNINIDLGEKAYTSGIIDLKYGARVGKIGDLDNELRVYGGAGGNHTTTHMAIFRQNMSSNVILNAYVDESAGCVADTMCGGIFEAIGSSQTVYHLRTRSLTNTANTQVSQFMAQVLNFDVQGEFRNVGGSYFYNGGGNVHSGWSNFTAEIDQSYAAGNGGVFIASGNAYNGFNPKDTSSGCYVMNGDIYHNINVTAPIINIVSAPSITNSVHGFYVDNVRAYAQNASKPTFISITGSGSDMTTITNCRTYGSMAFISDAGTGTKYLSLGNLKDGIQQ